MSDALISIKIATEANTKALEDVNKKIDGISSSAENSASSMERFTGRLKDMAYIGGAALVISRVVDAMTAFTRKGVELNASAEQMKIGIASLISVNSQNVTSMGRAVSSVDKYRMAVAQSTEVAQMLRRANAETPATLSQITEGYQAALAPAMRYGLTQKQTVDYTKLMTQAASAMGMELSQLPQEMRSILDAQVDSNSQVARNLGITNEQIKAHQKQGDLYQYLESKLRDFAAAGADMAGSFGGLSSNFEEEMNTVAAAASKPIFDGLKSQMSDAIAYLTASNNDFAATGQATANAAGEQALTNAQRIGLTLSQITAATISGFSVVFTSLYTIAVRSFNGILMAANTLLTGIFSIASSINNRIAGIFEAIGSIDDLGGRGQDWARELGFTMPDMSWADNYAAKLRNTAKERENAAKLSAIEVQNLTLENEGLTKSMEASYDKALDFYSSHSKITKEAAKSTETLIAKTGEAGDIAAKSGTKAAGAGKQAAAGAKAAGDAIKETADKYREYLSLTGQKAELFSLDATKKLQEFDAAGYSDEQLSRIYDAMWDKYTHDGKEAGKEIAIDFTDQFKNLFESLFKGDLKGAFKGLLEGVSMDLSKSFISTISGGLSSAISSLDFSKITSAFKSLTSGDWIGMAAGAAVSVLNSFNEHASEAEIKAAAGRSDWSDESISRLGSVLEDVQYPLLSVTGEMSDHIKNMDSNFVKIAKSLTDAAGASGIDITGAGFTETSTEGFLGFSSKKVSLAGSGLELGLQDLNSMLDASTISVRAYTSTLEESSSFWGLSTSSEVKTSYQNLPAGVTEDVADIFREGVELMLESAVSLGVSEVDVQNAIDQAQVNLGKIDFKGLSAEEASKRFEQAVGEAFSGVIGGIAALTPLISRYGKAGEESLETLGRIAIEYDQASASFAAMGKSFTDSTQAVTTTQITTRAKEMTALDKALGNSTEGYVESIRTVTSSLYTAQMQQLDIVAAVGGVENFNALMSSLWDNYYTEGERAAMQTKILTAEFAALGLAMPTSKAAYLTTLNGIDTSTPDGAELYGDVLKLNPAFASVTTAAASACEALKKAKEDMENFIASFNEWKIGLGDEKFAVLQEQAKNAQSSFDTIAASMGVTGLTIDNFTVRYHEAVNGMLCPAVIEGWNRLGDALMGTTDSARAVAQALKEAFESFVQKGRDFAVWRLENAGDDLGALRLKSEHAAADVTQSISAIGAAAQGVTVDSFLTLYNAAVAASGNNPDVIEKWNDLADALMGAGDAAKAVADALKEAFAGFVQKRRDFAVWRLESAGDDLGALKLQRQHAAADATRSISAIGAAARGVTEDNFIARYNQAAAAAGYDPAVIEKWKDLADALMASGDAAKAVADALERAFESFVQKGRDFAVWRLENAGDDLGALKLKSDYAAAAVAESISLIGQKAQGATVDNFMSLYNKAVAASGYDPAVIENWNALADALMNAGDAQKSYTDALNESVETSSYGTDMMLSTMTSTMTNGVQRERVTTTSALLEILKVLKKQLTLTQFGAGVPL